MDMYATAKVLTYFLCFKATVIASSAFFVK